LSTEPEWPENPPEQVLPWLRRRWVMAVAVLVGLLAFTVALRAPEPGNAAGGPVGPGKRTNSAQTSKTPGSSTEADSLTTESSTTTSASTTTSTTTTTRTTTARPSTVPTTSVNTVGSSPMTTSRATGPVVQDGEYCATPGAHAVTREGKSMVCHVYLLGLANRWETG
jgi:hypothetical protein